MTSTQTIRCGEPSPETMLASPLVAWRSVHLWNSRPELLPNG